MQASDLVAIGIQFGVPLAQEIFSHMWAHVTVPTPEGGTSNVTWSDVQAAIEAGRELVAAGEADADAEIAREMARLHPLASHGSASDGQQGTEGDDGAPADPPAASQGGEGTGPSD